MSGRKRPDTPLRTMRIRRARNDDTAAIREVVDSSALIDFAERRARELGLPAVTLYTNEAMVENLRLYPRLGFVETERRVEDGYRRVFFRKALDARELPR